MKTNPFTHSRPQGFTLIELLTVIAIIAILAAILIPVVGRVRDQARQAACTSNLRQIGLAAYLYAEEHGDRLPRNDGGNFPWDTSLIVMDTLAGYAGEDWMLFHCPSSRNDPSLMWDYGESTSNPFRITTYVLLFEGVARVDPVYTNSRIEEPLVPGARGRMVQVPLSQRELAVDATLSDAAGQVFKFPSARPGVDFNYSNHMTSDTQAAGGNVLYLDGSVQWRSLSEMRSDRVTGAPTFWW